ncbi:FG-GAP-like repeat-containing protein [Streptomyces sp. NPDC055400]
MRIRTTAALAALAAAALTPMALPTSAGATTTSPAKYADDFNGDGYRDIAVAAPQATVSGHEAAGAVVVLYGTASGPSAAKRKLITQASTGIPGSPETADHFGGSVASADLDLDGYADLVVGTPDEDTDGAFNKGSVTVVWGSAQGLGSGTVLPLTYGAGDPSGCAFGVDLAAVPASPAPRPWMHIAGGCSVWTLQGPITRTGKAYSRSERIQGPSTEKIVTGRLSDNHSDQIEVSVPLSDHPMGAVYINRVSSSNPPPLSTDASNATVGDVNGDGYGDLVLGDPGDMTVDGTPQEGTGHDGGQIAIWPGSAQGVDPAAQPLLINQSTPGVPGSSESHDTFGTDVTVADLNHDGFGDIAVGAPGETLGSVRQAGEVVIVPGGPDGPTGAGSYAITQNSTGVPGTAEHGDAFGTTVRFADLTKDGRADLVVGAPGELAPGATRSTGGIWVFKGTSTGVSLGSSYSVMAGTVGLPTTSDTNWSAVQAP